MKKLKPCPFCGSSKIQLEYHESETMSQVCQLCGASGPVILCGMEPARDWNERTNKEPR